MTFVHEYLHILSDPAHAAVEFTFVLADVLVIDAVRKRWRGWRDRLRARLTALRGAPATQAAAAA